VFLIAERRLPARAERWRLPVWDYAIVLR